MPPLLLSLASERGSKGGEEGGLSVIKREVGTRVAWLLFTLLTSCALSKRSWGELGSLDENDEMTGAWAEREGWRGEEIIVTGRRSTSRSRRDGRVLDLLEFA